VSGWKASSVQSRVSKPRTKRTLARPLIYPRKKPMIIYNYGYAEPPKIQGSTRPPVHPRRKPMNPLYSMAVNHWLEHQIKAAQEDFDQQARPGAVPEFCVDAEATAEGKLKVTLRVFACSSEGIQHHDKPVYIESMILPASAAVPFSRIAHPGPHPTRH